MCAACRYFGLITLLALLRTTFTDPGRTCLQQPHVSCAAVFIVCAVAHIFSFILPFAMRQSFHSHRTVVLCCCRLLTCWICCALQVLCPGRPRRKGLPCCLAMQTTSHRLPEKFVSRERHRCSSTVSRAASTARHGCHTVACAITVLRSLTITARGSATVSGDATTDISPCLLSTSSQRR